MMSNITRRQAIATLSLAFGALVMAGDSFVGESYGPTVKLGLDLEGGSYLVLEVDTSQGQSIEAAKEFVEQYLQNMAPSGVTREVTEEGK